LSFALDRVSTQTSRLSNKQKKKNRKGLRKKRCGSRCSNNQVVSMGRRCKKKKKPTSTTRHHEGFRSQRECGGRQATDSIKTVKKEIIRTSKSIFQCSQDEDEQTHHCAQISSRCLSKGWKEYQTTKGNRETGVSFIQKWNHHAYIAQRVRPYGQAKKGKKPRPSYGKEWA